MPVLARRSVRRMRGGAQAFLIEAADGHYYVVKFIDNPQHRRILVNEWVASILLAHLDISQPESRIIEVSTEFLREFPEVYIQLGSSRRTVTPGWHFGSRFPGDPVIQTVHDFLPDALMKKVANPEDFLGVLAFDKWAGNSDARQAIFFRARLGDWRPQAPGNLLQVVFVAQMMDHGYRLPPCRPVFRIERESIDKKTGAQSREIALWITSRTPQEASPKRVLAVNRWHWSIEGAHYIIDWNYDEDRSRTTSQNKVTVDYCELKPRPVP